MGKVVYAWFTSTNNMPKIKIKSSTTTGATPTTLQQGELAVNLADRRVWVGSATQAPIKIIDTLGTQEANNVTITGGNINGVALTTNSVNAGTLTLPSEKLYYDEGTRADLYTSNWNNSTTYNMTDFGGLGNVTAHGWTTGPATYTLTLTGLPAHAEVRYQCFLHYVDSVDNEVTNVFTMDSTGGETERLRMNRTSGVSPTYTVLASGTTVSWHANRFYSYAPWGGPSRTVLPDGGNGYVIMDTGWYSHTSSTFTARHVLGADQAQLDEAQYISHVKLWIRGSGATTTITAINTSASLTAVEGSISTDSAIRSYIDTNLKGMVKNVYVYGAGSHTYTKSGSDVKSIRVVALGAGGGGRGYGESGGAGGYVERRLDASGITSVSITVGSGGAGGNYFGFSPQGGTTSFGSYCSASGGFGANNHGSHIGGHGGLGSSGDINSYGGGGKGHNNGVNNPTNSAVGRGGAGFFGGSRNSHHSASRPADHGAPGGGGTASVGGAGGIGSDGRAGICIVYELR